MVVPLLENLTGFHRPKHQVKFVKINSNLSGEFSQARLGLHVVLTAGWGLRRLNHAHLCQTSNHVLVQDAVSFEAYVSQKVARLFVAESFDARVLREPIATFRPVTKAFQSFAQAHRKRSL